MDEIRCPGCGKIYREVAEFIQIEQAGLALMGVCPGCKTRQFIGRLWRVTERIVRSEDGDQYADLR